MQKRVALLIHWCEILRLDKFIIRLATFSVLRLSVTLTPSLEITHANVNGVESTGLQLRRVCRPVNKLILIALWSCGDSKPNYA